MMTFAQGLLLFWAKGGRGPFLMHAPLLVHFLSTGVRAEGLSIFSSYYIS
jgi:hypothetical protein